MSNSHRHAAPSQPDSLPRASSKPEGARLGWNLLETSYPYADKITRLRSDRIQISDGNELTYTYDERPRAVIIVPVTAQGEIVLIRQYRYPVDDWCLEVPAGGTHDTGNMPLEEVVRKELKEEIGGVYQRLEHVSCFYTSTSLSDEECNVYLALDVELSDKPDTEQTEQIEIQTVPAQEAVEMARSGSMKTGPCALAVLLCEPLLRRYGYVAS
jgi:ADP-ribose pyrophosphatase